jgi:hypothetical protein
MYCSPCGLSKPSIFNKFRKAFAILFIHIYASVDSLPFIEVNFPRVVKYGESIVTRGLTSECVDSGELDFGNSPRILQFYSNEYC